MSDAQPSLWSRIQEPSLSKAILAAALFGLLAAGTAMVFLECVPASSYFSGRRPHYGIAAIGLAFGWATVKIADRNAGYSGPIMMIPVVTALLVGILAVAIAMSCGWVDGSERMKTAYAVGGATFAIGAMGTIAVDVAR